MKISFLLMIFIITLSIFSASASITFNDPTPVNDSNIFVNHTTINATITHPNLKNFTWNWNGLNTTFLNDSCVLHLSFDNNSAIGDSSIVAVDTSQYGNNGSFINGSTGNWTIDGKWNGAMLFDGVDDHIICGNDQSLNMTESMSIEIWGKSISSSGYRTFISKKYLEWEFRLEQDSNFLKVYKSDGIEGYETHTYNINWNNNNYHHLIFTFNSTSKESKVYLDGKYKLAHTFSSGSLTNPNNYDVWIGERSGGTNSFNGTIDEIKIYNYVLTYNEVNQSYQSNLWKYTPTNWFFNTTQSNLIFGTYNYQCFDDDTASEYRIIHYTVESKISSISFTPDDLYQNYTGYTNVTFGVQHPAEYALNLSSLAFLFGINYTINNNYNHTIRVPSNEICNNLNGYKILRNNYRNISPYLSWEYNNTITEGNIYKWGGADNDTDWVTKNKINDTFTFINISTATMQIFPNMIYLGQRAMYEAPKIQFEISRAHSLIIKWWDLETINGRDKNFTYSGFFDTSLNPTFLPNDDIEIYWANNSFNPLTDDFRTSPYAGHLETWNYTRWNTHVHIPHKNASYCQPLVVNASLYIDPYPNEINYLIFASDTVSSKPYLLNVTNSDPGITNITFAETNTCWDYNELAQVSTAYPYTPSCFITFNRRFERLEYHLYIADNQSTWAHSDIYYKDIGMPNYPPVIPDFHHFKIWDPFCADWTNDKYMDATYNDGYIYINIQKGHDPDGGIVTHNLTLHYSNGTYVATINNSFPAGSIVDINFTSSDYYSLIDAYTFKVVATDDEGLTSVKWLSKNFTLAADGSQGAILDHVVSFWGYSDLPSLHTAINNESILSHDVGNDIYTMHYPFFKSKLNDSFLIDHTLHLKSINLNNVSYYRYRGHTDITNTSIHAWNTTTNTVAQTTDDYRAYIVSFVNAFTNITNSELSNLGIDEYRQEGLNYIDICNVNINNSTLAYNDRGIIFEYCDNQKIINSNINNNVQVGIGIYYTNNSNISNNNIKDNGRTGIRFYSSYDNQIINNTIDNSGYHGTWCQFSENNSYRENDIKNTGAGYYDYYFSSSSIDNQIIDPISTLNRIRSTSSSSVKINNTDNQVFSHNSVNFYSYAYPNNFSLLMTGISETIDIDHHEMWITPNESRLKVSNVEFNLEVNIITISPVNIPVVWFNMSNVEWINETVKIDRDNVLYSVVNASDTGFITYKYEGGYSIHTFRFYYTPRFQSWIDMFTAIPEALIIVKNKFINIIPFIISIIIFAGFGLALIVMTSRLKKW